MLKKNPIAEDALKPEQAIDDSKIIDVIKINYNDYFKNDDANYVNSDEDDEEESEESDEDYEPSEVNSNSNSNSAEMVIKVIADVNKKTDDEYNIYIEESSKLLENDRQPIDTDIDQQNQVDQPDEDSNNVDDSNNRPFFVITWNKQEEEEKYPVNKPIDYVIDSADRDYEIRYMKRKLLRIENLTVSTLQLLIVLALFVLVCNFLILITGASRKVRLFYFSPKSNQSQLQKQKHCDYKEKPLLDI